MKYQITQNNQYNSREVYFDGKPSKAVRVALKSLKMRWNHVKNCWYGFATESELIDSIQEAEPATETSEGATIVTDGYMGGGAIYGAKSGKSLYGADLSKAIREDLKRAGIKGASVRCKSYSGGQSITATLKLPKSAYVPREQFIIDYRVNNSADWIYYAELDENGNETGDETININKYYSDEITAEQQEKIRIGAAICEYRREAERENEINHYYIDEYRVFTAETLKTLKKVVSIIEAYRYDKSNAMVDYFDTNFYFDIVTKPVE